MSFAVCIDACMKRSMYAVRCFIPEGLTCTTLTVALRPNWAGTFATRTYCCVGLPGLVPYVLTAAVSDSSSRTTYKYVA